MSTASVVVHDVAKRFRIYHERNQSLKAAVMRGRRAKYEDFWALAGVSFEIREGATFGLVGPNGSGKSTMLKCIARILTPDRGSILTLGRLAALLELGSGFHPELSGRENVFLNGSILGLRRAEILSRFDEIVDFSGVERFIDQPVKNYSSGMYVRLAFAVAINVEPEILLVDEVLAVGDAAFQEKCLQKFSDFREQGRTVVIVSHALNLVRQMCDEVAWFQEGRAVAVGPAGPILDDYSDSSHAASGSTSGGNRQRTGGEMMVSSVEVLQEGHVVQQVEQGSPVRIRARYRSERAVARPVVSLLITSAEGWRVWGSNTREAGLVPDWVDGEGEAEFVIPRLALRPGLYYVDVALQDYTMAHDHDRVRAATQISVTHAGGLASEGVIDFGGMWMVSDRWSDGPRSGFHE